MRFVPQMSRNCPHIQLLYAWHAQYAHAFFLSIFVNVENKGSLNYIPKLEIRVRSPSPAPFQYKAIRRTTAAVSNSVIDAD